MARLNFEDAVALYLKKPTAQRWENIAHRSIPGSRHTTLWQAWVRVDGAAPTALRSTGIGERPSARKKWPNLPHPFTVRRAIREAVEDRVPAGWWWLEEGRGPKLPGVEAARVK